MAPLEHDPGLVRDTARELLDAPPYAEQAPGPIERFARWLLDQLASLLQLVLDDVTVAAVLPWVVVGSGGLRLGSGVGRLPRQTSLDRSVARIPDRPTGRTAADWDRIADTAEEAGELAAALRARYAALVQRLVDAELLEQRLGRTVRELDAELAEVAPELARRMRPAGARFEDVVYGGGEASGQDLDQLRALVRDVERAAGRRVPA
ncbi:MAG: DUF4129 domain-containing protein [Nitriliruptoraceae bacterium]|nr:DUF4129 domain-containing protein [Nitriliruptoraceae bacterium]